MHTITHLWQLWHVHLLLCQGKHFYMHTKLEYATHTVVVKTSLSGHDVTVWLQHLVLVPQMCSDRP